MEQVNVRVDDVSSMVELLEQFDLPEGFSPSRLKGVSFFKSLKHIPRNPLIYDPGIVIIAQGRKLGYLGDQVFCYDANNYLVLSIAVPFECETFANPDCPLLGVYIDIDMAQLHDLISQLGRRDDVQDETLLALPRGVGPACLDDAMTDATLRLLKCLQSETETQVLGPGFVREILYRALCGTQAPILYSLTRHNGNFARVASSLKSIHLNYATKIDVEQLAQYVNMSVSAFHRAFKEVTSDSPIQYLKKVRLNKARDYMVNGEMKAYVAAGKVGYESASQFSRDFKRYFGQSPTEMIRAMRAR